MSYETGSASNPNDLLDKLRIFALANGWTVDYYGGRTNAGGGLQAGSNNALAMNKAGLYFVLYHDTASNTTNNPTPRVRAYTYPGPWVATNGSDLQAGKTEVVAANNLVGPYQAYYFFTDPAATYLHAALEVVPGRFSHFGVGSLDKAGGGDPVPYAYGMSWGYSTGINSPTSNYHAIPFDSDNSNSPNLSTVFRCNSDGETPRNYNVSESGGSLTINGNGGFRRTTASYLHFGQQLMRIAPSALTGRAPLVPLILFAERTFGVFSIAGAARDMRSVRIDNITEGQVLTIGSDQWKVFPVVRKNGTTGVENSGNYGFAYRIVP